MTPKEKAVHLFEQMKGFRVKHTHSKRCAIRCVDAILDAIRNDQSEDPEGEEMYANYWKQVKSELEKL